MVTVGVHKRVEDPLDMKPKSSYPPDFIVTRLIGGRHQQIVQPVKTYLSNGKSAVDSYSLSKIERVTIEGGIRTISWVNPRRYTLTGCWPLITCSSDLPWLHRPMTSQDAWTTFPLVTESDIQQAVVKAHSKLDQLFVQSSVTAIESPQTLKMLRLIKLAKLIKSPVKTAVSGFQDLVKEVKKARRRPGKSSVSFSKKLSDIWLEYRMGLCPTLFEFDAYKSLIVKGIADYNSSILRVTSVYKKKPYVGTQGHQFVGYSNIYYNMVIYFQVSQQSKIGCTIFYKDRNLSDAQKYQVALGLDVGSIPLHLWETVPLSFVVDRFINVGEWLSAWKPKPGLEILDSIVSIKKSMESNSYYTSGPYGTDYQKEISPWKYTYQQLTRSKAPKLSSVPLLNQRALDFKQHLDHVGLLIQQIPNLLKKRARRP